VKPESSKIAVGCTRCGGSGYSGRVGIFSFFEVNEDVREAIRNECGEHEIAQRARKYGFQTLSEAALDLINDGMTTVEEVERVLGPLRPSTESCEIRSEESRGTLSHNSPKPERSGKPRVLLVEDDEDARSILSCVLEQELFEVDVADGGHEALEKLYGSAPDLIISDVMMPKMGGFELLQRLKSDRHLRDVPVLMLTANGSEEAELNLMTCGADDFVCKTTKMEIILARARRLIQREV
jgi:CheY-like chemotaxis protein